MDTVFVAGSNQQVFLFSARNNEIEEKIIKCLATTIRQNAFADYGNHWRFCFKFCSYTRNNRKRIVNIISYLWRIHMFVRARVYTRKTIWRRVRDGGRRLHGDTRAFDVRERFVLYIVTYNEYSNNIIMIIIQYYFTISYCVRYRHRTVIIHDYRCTPCVRLSARVRVCACKF